MVVQGTVALEDSIPSVFLSCGFKSFACNNFRNIPAMKFMGVELYFQQSCAIVREVIILFLDRVIAETTCGEKTTMCCRKKKVCSTRS